MRNYLSNGAGYAPEPLAGRYAIERELGRGGMATVYLAEDLKLHRQVALKLLRPELAASLGTERFLREIEIAARLSHPNILQLHDSGEINGRLFYAMPYVEGESLRQRLIREPQLPVEDVLDIVRAVAAALDHAHQASIIHRDIKPENILLAPGQGDRTAHPLVADFGIARALDVAGGERLTETGLALGTPAYMSPEQAAGGSHLDRRSDIYALGCVAYEMLAGAPPFTGPTAQSILARHAVDPVPPLHSVRPRLPRAIEDVVERALAKVPADRFSTAGEFFDALALAAQGRAGSRTRLYQRTTLFAAATVTLLAAVALAPKFLPGRSRDGESAMRLAGIVGTRAPRRADQPRLAVLPFHMDSSGTSDDYFAQGMHQEMISQLGLISGITVIDRASVLKLGDSRATPKQASRQLGADFLMRGQVRKDSAGVGLSVQLIDAETEREIWSDAYHREPTDADLSAIRSEVVNGIAEALKVKISSVERARISGRSTENATAYNLFLRATQLDYGSDPAAAVAAAELLKQAIALDSGFADAVAELGHVYSIRSYTQGQSRAWSDSAIVLARRAIQLDSSLPFAYHVLGLSHLDQGRLSHAAEAFTHSVRLNPNDGHALKALGWIEILRGNLAKAVPLLHDSRAVAPMDVFTYLNLQLIAQLLGDQQGAAQLRQSLRALGFKADLEIPLLLLEGKTPEAVAEAERLVAAEPTSFRALEAAARAYLAAANYRRAREHFETMHRMAPDDWNWWGLTYRTSYADVLLKSGERSRAMVLLDETLEDAKALVQAGDQRPGVQREIAAIYAAKGDLDQAYVWLSRAIDAGWRLEHIHPSQLFDFLRGTPRFHTLIARIEAEVQRAKEQVARAGLGQR